MAAAEKINLTKDVLSKLTCPPGKDRRWVYDSKTPGLAMMVTSSGARSFYVYRRGFEGKPQRVRLGSFPVVTIDQARAGVTKVTSRSSTASTGWPRCRHRAGRC